MSQRTLTGLLAVPLVLALLVAALFTDLPYATYAPGPTVDVLDQPGGSETVAVRGVKSYRDDGELRLTTVSVSRVDDKLSLPELIAAWWDDDEAVYPYDYVHPEDVTAEEDQREGAVSMVTSQDVAIAKVIGDVWLSALVGWVTGRSSAADTAQQIEVAVKLLLRD